MRYSLILTDDAGHQLAPVRPLDVGDGGRQVVRFNLYTVARVGGADHHLGDGIRLTLQPVQPDSEGDEAE